MAEQKTTAPLGSKRLSVDIPTQLHKYLKQLSVEQDTTVRELVVRALEQQYRLPSND